MVEAPGSLRLLTADCSDCRFFFGNYHCREKPRRNQISRTTSGPFSIGPYSEMVCTRNVRCERAEILHLAERPGFRSSFGEPVLPL